MRVTDVPALECSELEFLDRLCESGEALIHRDTRFYCAEALLRVGYARVAGTYGPEPKEGELPLVRRVEPTSLGQQIANIRIEFRKAAAAVGTVGHAR